MIADIRARAELLARLAQPSPPPMDGRHANRIFCVLAFSLPYVSNGYALRSHGLLRALARQGWDLRIHTRPGFPGDSDERWRGGDLPDKSLVDDLVYHRLGHPSRLDTPHMTYLLRAVDTFRALLLAERPALVHAASNHMTAMPALIAAHELGIPVIYEVRGFWDITRASSDPGFEGSSKYRHLRLFEDAVCRRADRLITLTGPMREELVRRGCDRERIDLVCNGVDAVQQVPVPRNDELAASIGLASGVPVIGYIGSFVDYEGLDDLIAAVATLKAQGERFQLLLVGDGRARDDLLQASTKAGLGAIVHAVGRVAPEAVPAHYALMDICAFPRKPWPVCELVSPLKPYEAMAHQKPIVVSGTAVLAEMVQPEITGLIFEKGNLPALVFALQRLLEDSALRRDLGSRAREWVAMERSWQSSAQACARSYARICGATSGLISPALPGAVS